LSLNLLYKKKEGNFPSFFLKRSILSTEENK